MSLTEPHLKMSKSHVNPKSRILITDSREEIEKKVKSALTDSVTGISYDPVNRPGVSNLLEIMFYLRNDNQHQSLQELSKDYDGLSMRALKEQVIECTDNHLAGIRDAYFSLIRGSESKRLDDAAILGASKASCSASRTMEIVKNAVGL